LKIEEVRASFTIYVISSHPPEMEGLAKTLATAGYMVATFSELTAAFSEIYSNPPHFLLFDFHEKAFDLQKAIAQVLAQLPESHVFLMVPAAERQTAVPFLERGVYDLILTPVAAPYELLKVMDRATERDYFMYLNEQLMNQMPQEVSSVTGVGEFPQADEQVNLSEDIHLEYMRRLFAQTSLDECLQVFMKVVSQALGGVGAVYFKYIANRRVLMASFAEQLETVDLQGLGLNLNQAIPGFRSVQLRDPLAIDPLILMLKEVFDCDSFLAWPIEALGEIQGIVCVLTPVPSPYMAQILHDWLTILAKALNFIEAEKRLHVVSVKDFHTDLLNRQHFLTKMTEEIARSRRTQLPVALISIALDQYGQVSSAFGQDEAQMVMRTTARILEKHSRLNDILARTDVDEFGILLPHTDKQGAMIKAERLRRIIESADFSRVLEKFPHMTISLGVSEYPTLVRDAEELKQSADEALYQVRAKGNKTCVAKVNDGFEADFKIANKAP
jgi:diguanylate cyclase (GGDEF)-like protein